MWEQEVHFRGRIADGKIFRCTSSQVIAVVVVAVVAVVVASKPTTIHQHLSKLVFLNRTP